MLSQDLKHDESQPLDYIEIAKVLHGRVSGMKLGLVDLEKPHRYEVKKFLPSHRNCCAILLSATIQGKIQRHWGVMIRNTNGIFFFESLGLGRKLKHLLDDHKFYDFLVQNKIKINSHRLQKDSTKIATCGLYVCVRVAKHEMTNNEFAKWLHSSPIDTDTTVTMLTIMGRKT